MKPQHNQSPSHFFIYFVVKTQPRKLRSLGPLPWIRQQVLYQLYNLCEWQGFRVTESIGLSVGL